MNPTVEREYLYLIGQAEREGNDSRAAALRFRLEKLRHKAAETVSAGA